MADLKKVAVAASAIADDDYRNMLPVPDYYEEGTKHREVYATLLDIMQADGSVLIESDFLSITIVVDCIVAYEQVMRESIGKPYTTINSRGDEVKHPIHTLVRQARGDLQAALKDAGLGPKARLYVEKATAITVLGN